MQVTILHVYLYSELYKISPHHMSNSYVARATGGQALAPPLPSYLSLSTHRNIQNFRRALAESGAAYRKNFRRSLLFTESIDRCVYIISGAF